MRKRSVLSVLALVAAAVVTVAAYPHNYGFNWNLRTEGSTGYQVLYAEAGIVSFGYPMGPTWAQVRIDGYWSGHCRQGFPYAGNWCADSAHGSFGNTFRSNAEVRGPVVPYGCYTATTELYIDGIQKYNYPIGGCWYPPPPPPDDGQDCDPGLDGTYLPGACVSPILIDTGKKPDYKLDPQVRVNFDLDADGSLEQAGWTKRNSTVAFLALDRNGNGVIDDGRELFGDHTRPDAVNGFDALLKEVNAGQAGSIDASHPLFARLLLWRDANQDGYSQPEELTPASDELEAVGLGYYLTSAEPDKVGNWLKYGGWARLKGGADIKIYDAYLRVQ